MSLQEQLETNDMSAVFMIGILQDQVPFAEVAVAILQEATARHGDCNQQNSQQLCHLYLQPSLELSLCSGEPDSY